MIWQDVVLMVGGFVFAIALFPSIFSAHKPSRITCLATGIVLVVFAIAYATLGLTLATISTALTALCWFILLGQKRR